MKLGQTSAVYFISKLVGSAIGFIATVFFARILGEVVLGQYSLVLALVTWLSVLTTVGIGSAITKRVSEGDEPEEFITAGFIILTVLTLLISISMFIMRDLVNDYVGFEVAELVIILVILSSTVGIVTSSLKGYHLVHIYALLTPLQNLSRSTLQIILVISGLSLTGMLYGYAISSALYILAGLWYLGFRPTLPRKDHFVSIYNYAKFSWLGNIRSKAFSWVDIAVLGLFVPTGLVGIYSVAWTVAKVLDIFGNAITTTLFPEMSKLSSDGEIEAVSNLTENSLTYAGLFIIPGLIGSIVVGDLILSIYGEQFVNGKVVLSLLTAGLLVYTYKKQLVNTLNAVDRPDLAFRANLVFVILNVLLNILFIYLFGWIGAAVATGLAAAVGFILSLKYSRSIVPFEIPIIEIAKQIIAALMMGAIVHISRGLVNSSGIPEYNEVFAIILVAYGGGVYIIILMSISSRFRTTVENNSPIKIRRYIE